MKKTFPLKPIGDRVLVKRDDPEEKTEGGLYVPDSGQEKPDRGEIVACGKVYDVKVGDKIIFTKYAGIEQTVSGREYVMMRECDILGVLE